MALSGLACPLHCGWRRLRLGGFFSDCISRKRKGSGKRAANSTLPAPLFAVFAFRLSGLSAEVVVHDALGLYAETVEHGNHGLRHGTGTAHIVLDVLGSFVVFEIGLKHHLMDEARRRYMYI